MTASHVTSRRKRFAVRQRELHQPPFMPIGPAWCHDEDCTQRQPHLLRDHREEMAS